MSTDVETELEIHPVTADRWEDLADLFERPGPRGGRQDTANCWCVIWRQPFGEPDENRDALRERVDDGDVPGLLAYRAGEPVGWVSVARREHFPSLLRSSRFRPRDDDEDVFVITCFAVDRRVRGRGVGPALLEAAVDHAVTEGASAIEAYPGDDYKGLLEWFLDRGFEPLREVGKRTVVRLTP